MVTHNEDVVDTLKIQPQVGKVHAVFGEPNPVYERALRLHEAHSDLMGHPMFVLRERLLSGLWSKPAFILSIMLQELAKPEDKRLKWLLYASSSVLWYRAENFPLLILFYCIGGLMRISW